MPLPTEIDVQSLARFALDESLDAFSSGFDSLVDGVSSISLVDFITFPSLFSTPIELRAYAGTGITTAGAKILNAFANASGNVTAGLQAIPLKILAAVIIEAEKLPKKFGWRVMKLDDVWPAIATGMAEKGIEWITNPFNFDEASIAVQWLNRVSFVKKLLDLFRGILPSARAFIQGKIVGLLGVIILFIQLLWSIAGAVVLVAVLVGLYDWINKNLMRYALSQAVKRRKVKLEAGGSIYRREPGGVPP